MTVNAKRTPEEIARSRIFAGSHSRASTILQQRHREEFNEIYGGLLSEAGITRSPRGFGLVTQLRRKISELEQQLETRAINEVPE